MRTALKANRSTRWAEFIPPETRRPFASLREGSGEFKLTWTSSLQGVQGTEPPHDLREVLGATASRDSRLRVPISSAARLRDVTWCIRCLTACKPRLLTARGADGQRLRQELLRNSIIVRPASRTCPFLRGWRNTFEIVLFEIFNSMKPYPSVFHTYTSTAFLTQEQVDEVSNCIPPASQFSNLCAPPVTLRVLIVPLGTDSQSVSALRSDKKCPSAGSSRAADFLTRVLGIWIGSLGQS